MVKFYFLIDVGRALTSSLQGYVFSVCPGLSSRRKPGTSVFLRRRRQGSKYYGKSLYPGLRRGGGLSRRAPASEI